MCEFLFCRPLLMRFSHLCSCSLCFLSLASSVQLASNFVSSFWAWTRINYSNVLQRRRHFYSQHFRALVGNNSDYSGMLKINFCLTVTVMVHTASKSERVPQQWCHHPSNVFTMNTVTWQFRWHCPALHLTCWNSVTQPLNSYLLTLNPIMRVKI